LKAINEFNKCVIIYVVILPIIIIIIMNDRNKNLQLATIEWLIFNIIGEVKKYEESNNTITQETIGYCVLYVIHKKQI